MAQFSIERAVSFGWKTVKDHWTTLIPVVLMIVLVSGAITNRIDARHPMEKAEKAALWNAAWHGSMDYHVFGTMFVGDLLKSIVAVIFAAILMRVSLQYVDGKAKDFQSLFRGITPEMLVRVVFASILLNFVVAFGLFFLVIPGLYLALRYSLALYVIVDGNAGLAYGFRRSGELTKGVKLQLLVFAVACALMLVAGALVLGVGIILTIPVVLVAVAHVYRQLTKSVDKHEKVKKPAVATA